MNKYHTILLVTLVLALPPAYRVAAKSIDAEADSEAVAAFGRDLLDVDGSMTFETAFDDDADEDDLLLDGRGLLAQAHKKKKPSGAHKKTPAHKTPAHKKPAHKTPAHKTPAHKTPAHKTPAHKTPAHKKPPKRPLNSSPPKVDRPVQIQSPPPPPYTYPPDFYLPDYPPPPPYAPPPPFTPPPPSPPPPPAASPPPPAPIAPPRAPNMCQLPTTNKIITGRRLNSTLYPSSGIRPCFGPRVSSPADCCTQCQSNPTCVAWTFTIPIDCRGQGIADVPSTAACYLIDSYSGSYAPVSNDFPYTSGRSW